MGAEVSVPIWLLAMLGAGFTALVFAAWLFGRGDLRGALDMARDWETKATFAAIKEETGRACRRAILALSVEQAAFSAVPLAAAHGAARSRPYLTSEPGPHILVKPLVPVTYINPSSDAASWAVDVKPGAVILNEPEPEPVPDGDRRVEVDDDGYPPCLQAEAASVLRRQTREIAGDKRNNAGPGRHRLVKPRSDDTRQFSAREVLDAVVVEAGR